MNNDPALASFQEALCKYSLLFCLAHSEPVLSMTIPNAERRTTRTRRSILVASLSLAALLAVFFYTQVVDGARYRAISEANRPADADR